MPSCVSMIIFVVLLVGADRICGILSYYGLRGIRFEAVHWFSINTEGRLYSHVCHPSKIRGSVKYSQQLRFSRFLVLQIMVVLYFLNKKQDYPRKQATIDIIYKFELQ